MTDLRAAMRRAVSDTGEPGAAELYQGLAEALLDSAAAEGEGPVELERMVQQGQPVHIVDVRAAEDYAEGHIPGAVWVPGMWPSSHSSRSRTSTQTAPSTDCASLASASVISALTRWSSSL